MPHASHEADDSADRVEHAATQRQRIRRPIPRPAHTPSELDAYTIPEVAGMLQISEKQVDNLIAARELGKIKIGTSTRVTYRQYAAYLRKKEIEDGFKDAA